MAATIAAATISIAHASGEIRRWIATSRLDASDRKAVTASQQRLPADSTRCQNRVIVTDQVLGTGYEHPGGSVASAFRLIAQKIPTVKDLNLPPILEKLVEKPRGLILVTGSVGAGKSTTLAALVEQVNLERREHIITLEDPIEYVFESKGCHITQREVHTHTRSFSDALRASLREDPDVIMVGEMRDLETISLAITASETGHLVLGTLHTGTASRTLDRVLDVFPADQQEQIRVMVSESLRGIISQQLIPRADGTGRVLALETLTNTPAVSNVIREAKTFMLPGIIQTSRKQGMQLMDDTLIELFGRNLITADEALARAEQKEIVRQHLGRR